MSLRGTGLACDLGGRRVVDGVDVDPPAGGMLGLLGPNGSGKSTLLRALAGQVRPAAGVVELDGDDVSRMRRRDVARRIAVVEQQATTQEDLTAGDVVGLGRIPHRPGWAGPDDGDADVVERAARRTGVDHLLHRPWRALSGGEQQRVQLARAFAQETDVLLLDEPTNHLDVRSRLDVLALAAASPKTVVVALHDVDLAAMFCDELLVLRGGRVQARGTPADVLDADLVERVYGVRCVVEAAPAGASGSSAGAPLVRFLPPTVEW